jgi:hypothetical protein
MPPPQVFVKGFLIMATLGGTCLVAPLAGPADFFGGDEVETGLGVGLDSDVSWTLFLSLPGRVPMD